MKESQHGGFTMRSFISVLAALALTLACSGEESNPTDEPTDPKGVSAEVSPEISTVVTVRWTSEKPSIGYVEYGETKSLGKNTPLGEEGTDHEQLLLGLKADTVYYYRVVTWSDGGDAGASETKSIRTGYLPSGMPEFEVTGTGHDDYIIAPLLGVSEAIVILDPQGNVVWYHSDEDSDLSYYRARLSRDKKSILYNHADISGDVTPDSELVRISLDGTLRTSMPIPFLAHDFIERPDGTLAAIVLEDREDADGNVVRGNKIVELDTDGNLTDIWTSWNCFDPVDDPGDDMELGWTFANALDFNDDEPDAYYVSMRNFSSIARVNRNTGACEWVLGFTGSTLRFAQGSARFEHEHQFQVFGNHLLVMDNDGSPTETPESRIVEYELDLEAGTATEVWRYLSTPTVYTFVLGEPIRYTNGDTLIDWSLAGQIERVTAEGEKIWQLNSKAGAAFGFDTVAKTLYPENAQEP